MLRGGSFFQDETISLVSGEWAEDTPAVLRGLLDAPDHEEAPDEGMPFSGARGCDWEQTKTIVTLDRRKLAVGTFGHHKGPGEYVIFPILLKKRSGGASAATM